MPQKIDVIGDIHGRADLLARLLTKLGYALADGAYVHPNGRVAIFVGDLVDGSAGNLDTVEIVAAMVARGSARMILGNHDFNIICFNRANPERPGHFLRSHSVNHARQCAGTQGEIEADPRRGRDALKFLAAMPLWLDTPHMRAVHAFWDADAQIALRPFLESDNSLTHQGFAAVAGRTSDGDARAQLLSGPEENCEPYLDRYGNERSMDRVPWWLEPDERDPRPIFFGHYALPAPLQIYGNAVCVDAGVAKGGPLAAYSHDAFAPLHPRKFTYVGN